MGPFVANQSGSLTTKIGIDMMLPRGLYYANNGGTLDSRSLTFTVEARKIDDTGAALEGEDFVTLGTHTITEATNTPLRRTFSYNVDEARYEVRAKRTSDKDNNARSGNDLFWKTLRAYLPEHKVYPGVTLLAVKIRATNNIVGQAMRRINVIATRKLPLWDASTGTWSAPTATTKLAPRVGRHVPGGVRRKTSG